MENHELTSIPTFSGERLHQPTLSNPSPVDRVTPKSSVTSGLSQIETTSADPLLPPHNLFLIIPSLYLGTFLVALDTTIINTALPAITSHFHSLSHLAWYSSAYLLALTALQPTFGKLYKSFDTKTLYLISIIIFEIGSILCAAAPSSIVFILGRAVAGCGAAGLMQGSFAIVVKTVASSKRPFYFGLFVSAFGVSTGVGPVLGGWFADRGVWRWCFWM